MQAKQQIITPAYVSLMDEHSRPQKEERHLKTGDRNTQFASLQRKLEYLENVHHDEKRAHLLELDRIKAELDRHRKVHKDQADKMALLKKQHDVADARNQEMRKSSLADQSELKSLRHKIRMVEQERDQLTGKHTEISDLKRALHSAEAKRREENQEKDRKLAETQKLLSMEKQKLATVESRLDELKRSADAAEKASLVSQRNLKQRLEDTEAKARDAESTKETVRVDLEATNDSLLEQVERLNSTLKTVAEEYGRLAASSVAAATHRLVKSECTALRLKVARLERKLANSDDQVSELVSLIRQCQENEVLLKSRLRDEEARLKWTSAANSLDNSYKQNISSDDSLIQAVDAILSDMHRFKLSVQEDMLSIANGSSAFYKLQRNELLYCYQAAECSLGECEAQLDKLEGKVEGSHAVQARLASDLESLRDVNVKLESEKMEHAQRATTSNAEVIVLNQKLAAAATKAKADIGRSNELLAQERMVSQRLQVSAQQSKMAEEGLKAEMEEMMLELEDAGRYREAYEQLVKEVESLVDRNALAEEEADKLSRFNAMILGHHNPTQRILYVDRIRRELAEVKQRLVTCTRERDTALSDNGSLTAELAMFKSVAIPRDAKPRTLITRVTRVPLAPRGIDTNLPTSDEESFDLLAAHLPQITEGEMTLDEIM
ncbi:hypothetical protein BD410DRAFT_898201 [Rickenella mellea]|uniref:Hyaluronan-mediated motility receptor C-terminal domain-containing protein n=1 Tax=Rickenella mellea TaxID=50990 RepID=A0A4Y7Q5P2_9AGAM|nr:hypothetical protein BD410DRAFT_898201 [Rickenella mellea]